ncbi:MAG: nicotinamide mononucleotide transporter [Bacteroidales bacterium]|nr:nicotinamide mononucleotide transporter [Bacteroidales bacterium]
MLLEIFGVVFGFIYLYLEIKQKQGMWLVGFLMAAVYAVVYFQQEVYASMGFQIYYVLVSIYGFLQWGKDKLNGGAVADGEGLCRNSEKVSSQILYRRITLKVLMWSLLVYAVSVSFMVLVLGKFTEDPMPFADSSITVVSAIATFWLSKSYREQWLAWLVVNSFTVVMCARIGLYPTAVLYFVNAAASVYGYLHWKRKGELIE